MFLLPSLKGIIHRWGINWPRSVPTLQGKHWEKGGKKNHSLLFSSKHTGKLNTSQQIVCNGAEVSHTFQKHQKTWETRGHMHKRTQQTQPHNKTSAAWAARARSIDFHWRGHIRLQECTHLIFMRLKAHRNNNKKIPTLWHINVTSEGQLENKTKEKASLCSQKAFENKL